MWELPALLTLHGREGYSKTGMAIESERTGPIRRAGPPRMDSQEVLK